MKFRFDKQQEKLIIQEATRVEYFQLKSHLTRHVKNYRFNPRFKLGVWDGTVSHFNDGAISMGLWKECLLLCQQNDWKFEITNKQDFPIDRDVTYEKVEAFCKRFFVGRKLKNGVDFFPYAHQIQSAFKILKNRYCITEVATGGGKSLIFSLVAFYILDQNPNAKFLLIVPNISLCTQFYDDITDYNMGWNNENQNPLNIKLEEIMSDRPRRSEEGANIFIGTFQSLEKRPKEWFHQFTVVAGDEFHKAGHGSTTDIKLITKVINYTIGHAKLRFGMSGTFPAEDTLDYLMIQSLTGPKIAEVRADTLMEKGVIAPVRIKTLILNHNDASFAESISMIKKSGNAKGAYECEKKYIQESDKRVFFVVDKLMTKITKNTLVLFHIKEYGLRIVEAIKQRLLDAEVYYIDGDVKSADREAIKKRMEDTADGKPKFLVASFGTLSTGVSIKALFNVIFMESFKSEQIIIQSIGRILRLHDEKETALVFDVVDIYETNPKVRNTMYMHYLERRGFYEKRNYPFSEVTINL